MPGYISSWKFGQDEIADCSGDVFPFDLDGVTDTELAVWLQQSGPFSDSGPCPGKVPVQFAEQGKFAVDIRRSRAQISWQESNGAAPGVQALRAVNRIPISSGTLNLDQTAPLAGEVSAGLQIHHPKGSKRLTSVLHFGLNKPQNARVVLTVHHGAKTKTVSYRFGKRVAGNHKVKVNLAPQAGMAGVHHVWVHGYVQRKDSDSKVRLNLKHLDVS